MTSLLDILDVEHPEVPFHRLDLPKPTIEKFRGENYIIIPDETLTQLTNIAFHDMNLYLRRGHLQQLANILKDDEASPNDKYVALELLKNANIAAGGIFPMCQDTGTGIVMAKKGRRIWTAGHDKEAISRGIAQSYHQNFFRYSQLSPIASFREVNTKDNLPAQIEIYSEGKDDAYEFLFIAKGGGSANKSYFYQPSPALLQEDKLLPYLADKFRELGTSACPPYHLAVVIGGTSAEMCMKTVKLATCRYLDNLPTTGGDDAHAFRDKDLEEKILQITRNLGIGAQFGGKYFCHDVRVIRLPRHAASLPIGIAVSCSADRQTLAHINRDGVFLESLCTDPAEFLPDIDETNLVGEAVPINLNQPMKNILAALDKCPVKTRVSLSGTVIVARDMAHQKLAELLHKTGALPDYFKNHPIYYAGPAKTPDGMASGSFGPTTAGRMDGFVDQLQAAGGSMVMLAKGNRSKAVTYACKKHGGFYLGSIGGPAARLGRDRITKVEVLDLPELGMEAVRKITVKDMPAFVVIDNKGNDFYEGLTRE